MHVDTKINKKGFTLLEVLIAVAVFSTVMVVGIEVYLSSSRTLNKSAKALMTLKRIREATLKIFFEIQESKEIIKPLKNESGNWIVFRNEHDNIVCIYRDDRYNLIRKELKFKNEKITLDSEFVDMVFKESKNNKDTFLKSFILHGNDIYKYDLDKFIVVLRNSDMFMKSRVKEYHKNEVLLGHVHKVRFANFNNNRVLSNITVFEKMVELESKEIKFIGEFTMMDEVFLMNSEYLDRGL